MHRVEAQRRSVIIVDVTGKTVLLCVLILLLQQNILTALLSVQRVQPVLPIRYPSDTKPEMKMHLAVHMVQICSAVWQASATLKCTAL